jgi:hypothetical protein
MVSAESVPETQVIPENEPGRGDPIRPLNRLLPVDPVTSSDRLGWVGLEAVRYHASPAFEFNRSIASQGGTSWRSCSSTVSSGRSA